MTKKSKDKNKRPKKVIMEKIEDGENEEVINLISKDATYTKPDLLNDIEFIVFRALSAVMVVFFMVAAIFLKEDDNSCLWIPLFLIPAFLSLIVVIKPQLSESTWWKGWHVIHTVLSMLLAILWIIQWIRSIQKQRDTVVIQGGNKEDLSLNPLDYEEGMETLGIIIIVVWMKITSYVSKHQFRSKKFLPAPKRIVATALYMSSVPLLLTALCFVRCSYTYNTCLAILDT